MAYCPNCGDEVDGGAAFCASCGASVDGEPATGEQTANEPSPGGDSGSDRQRTADRERPTGDGSTPLGLGLVAGVLAFAAGYAVTWVQKSGEASETLGQLSSLGSSPETWQAVGWVFMAMHNVALEATRSGAGQSASQTFGADAVQEQWLLLVPVVALVFAGYYVAKSTGPRQSSAKAGASVVLGYFVCAIAIAFLSTWTFSTSTFGQTVSLSIGPKLIEAAAIAGVGYPVVLGAVGGVLADS
ncbi:zinc-ribbon domain-containing protein [Halobacterium litoreum]|uniref:Zinc-ribbon domain-containing protein n=1 Tax=Halobacterium litoreum TaxID=2039234 RepID=A0ABD5NJ23_9EURY|nr:zinc-ribbon domain-containing protein [Halobacterium litoreum]UHH12252.1 zinc-ribbon domain-containing protein [Halobacterium litoreum]